MFRESVLDLLIAERQSMRTDEEIPFFFGDVLYNEPAGDVGTQEIILRKTEFKSASNLRR